MNTSALPTARTACAGPKRGNRISTGFAASPIRAIAAALGRKWRIVPLGVSSSRGPKRSGATSASITRMAPFFRLTARGKREQAAARQIEQGEFVAHQPPAALAEQGRERRFARPGFAGEDSARPSFSTLAAWSSR